MPAQPLWVGRKALCNAFQTKAAEGGHSADLVDGLLPEWLEVRLCPPDYHKTCTFAVSGRQEGSPINIHSMYSSDLLIGFNF